MYIQGFKIKNSDVRISLDGKVVIDSPELVQFVKDHKSNTSELATMDFLCKEEDKHHDRVDPTSTGNSIKIV